MTTTTLNPGVGVEARPRALMPGGAGLAATAIVIGAAYLANAISWRQAALFLVGAVAGVVLYHAAFGFTSSWRVFISVVCPRLGRPVATRRRAGQDVRADPR